MKNIFTIKKLAVLCMMLSFASISQANRYEGADCCPTNDCCDRVYDCGDPLNCGSLNFMLRAGVAPTLWRDRGNFSLVSCNALAIPGFGQSVIDIFQLPKFSKFFHVPWLVGGQIGYALTNHFEVYLEFNYRSARAREFTLSNLPATPNETVNVILNLQDHYRVFDAYIGGRYYWGRCWCDQVAFFLGAKFGLVHHKPVCFQFVISPLNCPPPTGSEEPPVLNSVSNLPFFFRNTTAASGLNFGFDWCIGCGWSLMFTAEVVASCGPSSNDNIVLATGCPNPVLPNLGVPGNIIIGHIGTELFFPITLGLKYSF